MQGGPTLQLEGVILRWVDMLTIAAWPQSFIRAQAALAILLQRRRTRYGLYSAKHNVPPISFRASSCSNRV